MSTVKPSNISSSASSSIALSANGSGNSSTPGVRGAKTLPLLFNTSSHSGRDPHVHHTEAANAVLSLILVIMVGFVAFMSVFFWRKYKHITLSVPTYQYSRLSQHEGEADLSEVVDQLGLTLGNSSSDDELEPATLPISASQYQGPHTGSFITPAVPTAATNGNVAALSSALLDDSDEELLQ